MYNVDIKLIKMCTTHYWQKKDLGSEKLEFKGKTYFNNCKVYTFSNRQIKAMKPFKNYGGRFISLKEKNEKY